MKILTLLFTYNTSLEDWINNGSIDREINIYTNLLEYFDKIYLITYGQRDKKFQHKLPDNIIILQKKYTTPNFLYSLLIPIAYKKELKMSSWVKTNQIMGSWTAVLIKVCLRKKIAIRTGYTESLSFVGENTTRRYITWLIEFIAYKFADMSIVTSVPQQKYLIKKYNIKNINVIPNGINTKIFKPLKHTNISTTLRLLFIGRLHKEKNVINLVSSLKNLNNVKLIMIGYGNLRREIINLKNKYNLNLTIIKRISNSKLPLLYNAADIYIQPSLYEGNPKTILEAMSCELPIIATNVAGIKNVIENKQNGYLCETDVPSIANAISALRKDTNLKIKIANNARNFILTNYNLSDVSKKEIALYKNYQ